MNTPPITPELSVDFTKLRDLPYGGNFAADAPIQQRALRVVDAINQFLGSLDVANNDHMLRGQKFADLLKCDAADGKDTVENLLAAFNTLNTDVLAHADCVSLQAGNIMSTGVGAELIDITVLNAAHERMTSSRLFLLATLGHQSTTGAAWLFESVVKGDTVFPISKKNPHHNGQLMRALNIPDIIGERALRSTVVNAQGERVDSALAMNMDDRVGVLAPVNNAVLFDKFREERTRFKHRGTRVDLTTGNLNTRGMYVVSK